MGDFGGREGRVFHFQEYWLLKLKWGRKLQEGGGDGEGM